MSLRLVHKFIERLDRDAACVASFRSDPSAAMQAAGLNVEEIEQLSTASLGTLAALGVHPLLQIRYLRARFPERGSFMSVKEWAERLPLEMTHG